MSETENKGMIACESCGYEPDTVEEYLELDKAAELRCPKCGDYEVFLHHKDSLEMIKGQIAHISTLTAQVAELREALEAIGAHPNGFCCCPNNRGSRSRHCGECIDARLALASTAPQGGE